MSWYTEPVTPLEQAAWDLHISGDLTQKQIGEKLGRKQVQVSQLLHNYVFKWNRTHKPEEQIKILKFFRYKKPVPGFENAKDIIVRNVQNKNKQQP